jgi:hypothetical protein
MGAHGRASACVSVHGRAWACVSVHGRAWACVSVHGRACACMDAHACARMCVHGRAVVWRGAGIESDRPLAAGARALPLAGSPAPTRCSTGGGAERGPQPPPPDSCACIWSMPPKAGLGPSPCLPKAGARPGGRAGPPAPVQGRRKAPCRCRPRQEQGPWPLPSEPGARPPAPHQVVHAEQLFGRHRDARRGVLLAGRGQLLLLC